MDNDISLCDDINRHHHKKDNQRIGKFLANDKINITQSPISPMDIGMTQDNMSKNDENVQLKDHSFKISKPQNK